MNRIIRNVLSFVWFLHSAYFESYPCCYMHQQFIPFYHRAVFHRVYIPQRADPFTSWGTFGGFQFLALSLPYGNHQSVLWVCESINGHLGCFQKITFWEPTAYSQCARDRGTRWMGCPLPPGNLHPGEDTAIHTNKHGGWRNTAIEILFYTVVTQRRGSSECVRETSSDMFELLLRKIKEVHIVGRKAMKALQGEKAAWEREQDVRQPAELGVL